MRVLHSTDVYLGVSENWIYPQITRVPGTETRVICDAVANLQDFPIESARLHNTHVPWNEPRRMARLGRKFLHRSGIAEAMTMRWLRGWSPQVVHSHFGTRGQKDLRLKRKLGIPLVTSFYGYDAWALPETNPAWRQLYTELFRDGDLFLVEGPAMKQRVVALGCPPEKVQIIRIGVDVSSFPFRERSFGGELKILMVGRYVEKKGFVDGMRACAIARGSGANLRLTVVGDARPEDAKGQEIKRTLLEIARQPELSGHVNFTGFLPPKETYALLSEHDVLLCPSKHASDGDAEGGSPVVLTAAMGMGLLCIGTRHCDIPEVIIDNETGFLCSAGDVDGLAEILKGIAAGERKVIDIPRAGRQHIEKNFNLTLQLEKISGAYRSFF